MKFDGTNWVNVGNAGFSAGAAGSTSLALDSASSTPYVAFPDAGDSFKATVMKFDGTNWVNVGSAGFSAGLAGSLSLALDGSTPYVAYQDGGNNDKATVMKFDGTNWVTVGTAGFSAGKAQFTSLALDGSTPYVAFEDGGNSNKITVMTFDGTNWVDVGSAGFSAGLGGFTSLALDGSRPYVAFLDEFHSNKATVMVLDNAQSGPNFVVTQSADTDDGTCGEVYCTLPEALTAANTDSGNAHTITFDIPETDAGCAAANECTITLGGTLPAIDNANGITIDGSSNLGKITISGNSSVRILVVNAGKLLELNALTLANGVGSKCTDHDCGGAVLNNGSLAVTNSTFLSNSGADAGGAIANFGALTVSNSTFTNNSAGSGAGINNYPAGTANVTNSTFAGNHGSGITNSGTVNLKNSILADNAGGDCFNVNALTGSYNLFKDPASDHACGLTNGTDGNIVGSDPSLAALADNGGATQTMALQYTSIAIDAGDKTACNAAIGSPDYGAAGEDQRGSDRNDLNCDIGAYEMQFLDSDTVAKNGASGDTFTFGPTLAKIHFNDALYVSVNLDKSAPGNTPPADALPLVWDLTEVPTVRRAAPQPLDTLLDVTFCYHPAVLNGQTETDLHVYQYLNNIWTDIGGTLDTLTYAPLHCVTADQTVTSLSQFILAPKSAAAVDVAGLKGSVNAKGNVLLKWRTTSEARIAGFNIYRRTGKGEWKQINKNLKQAKYAGSAQGAAYRFINRKVKEGNEYRYKLQVVYLDRHREWTNIIRVPVK